MTKYDHDAGWMVNLCAVLLELCRPFMSSSSSGPKLLLIQPSYPSSPVCRLQLSGETCLAGGIIGELQTELPHVVGRLIEQQCAEEGSVVLIINYSVKPHHYT